MINNEIYQKIFDELSKYLLNGWEKLVVYLEYGSNSYSFSFYEKIEGEYIKCFDIPNVDETELDVSFRIIDKTISADRNELSEKWSNMTMTVDKKGSMHTDFDYTDLSSGNYKYIKEWKEKYLL